MKTIEFRVRPVTRYIVTRHEEKYDGTEDSSGCQGMGEFDSEVVASNVVLALGAAETITVHPSGQSVDKIIIVRPLGPKGHTQIRTWTRGEGWDDVPAAEDCAY